MAMKGRVHAINWKRGMVAITTERHGYTIIDLLSDQNNEVGDEMGWTNNTGCGGQTYRNMTKNRDMNVYVQNHWVPELQLRQQLRIGSVRLTLRHTALNSFDFQRESSVVVVLENSCASSQLGEL